MSNHSEVVELMNECADLRTLNTRLRALNTELVAALAQISLHADANMEGAGEPEFSQFSWVVGRASAAIARAKGEPKLEPQNYKIQPPTFVDKS